MVEISLMFIIFVIISAIWGIQIAEESTLALKVKQFLHITQPYSQRLIAFGTFKFWWRFTGRFSIILMPLVLFFVLIMKLHHFASSLCDCSKCTSTWIFALLSYFILQIPLLYAIILAPLPIVIIYLFESIKHYEN